MPHTGKLAVCVDPDMPHTVDRAVCLLGGRPGCGSCPNRTFTLRFKFRLADQSVACPRWRSEEDRNQRKDPTEYVMVPRGQCLTGKPFVQCEGCPNGRAEEASRSQPRWWEAEEKARRLERELDEEDRDGS